MNSFPVLNSSYRRWPQFSRPVVAHVRFLGTMNPTAPGGHVPLSNTCAALIEVI
jgi:hypothetical protein